MMKIKTYRMRLKLSDSFLENFATEAMDDENEPALLVYHRDSQLEGALQKRRDNIRKGVLCVLVVSAEGHADSDTFQNSEREYGGNVHYLRWRLENTPNAQSAWKLARLSALFKSAQAAPRGPVNWGLLAPPARPDHLLAIYIMERTQGDVPVSWWEAAREEFEYLRADAEKSGVRFPAVLEANEKSILETLQAADKIWMRG